MTRVSKQEGQEFLRHLKNIPDDKVRYFLMMLTDAIGQTHASGQRIPKLKANASPAHFAEIARRVNAKH